VKARAYAKVNLTLEVHGIRGDGYHALSSLVLPVSLWDDVEVEPAESLSCDSGFPDDLCIKAAKILDPGRGAAIHVVKRIPCGGGLGGGSADAAATLAALNELWGLGKAEDEMVQIAAQVGSDVPALLLGGLVVMEGRGEVVRRALPPGTVARPVDLVLASPGVFSSTAEVYAKCTSRPSGGPSATAAAVAALASGDIDALAAAMVNDLQEPALSLHPEMADALVSLRTAGAVAAMASGSGSTVFGLARDAAQAAAIAGRLNARGLKAWAVRSVL